MSKVKRYRWIVLVVVSGLAAVGGETGTARELISDFALAAAMWYWGFDLARRPERRLYHGFVRPETERVLLFAAALLGAVLMIAGARSYRVARVGEEALYLAAGITIKRQGYRIGSKHRLAWWEWRDELKYGAIGDLVMMLAGGAVVIATGMYTPLGLLLVVLPIGMIALGDDPVYPDDYRNGIRGLAQIIHRRMGIRDEAW